MEVVVAVGVGVLVSLGVGQLLIQMQRSSIRFDKLADANEFLAHLTSLINNPQQCEYAIGHGYSPFKITYGPLGSQSSMNLQGLTFNPDQRVGSNQPAPQDIVIRDPNNPTRNLYEPGVNISPRLQLGSMTLTMTQEITTATYSAGFGTIRKGEKTQYDATHPVVRRLIAVVLRVTLNDTSTAEQVSLNDRVIPLVVEVETPFPVNPASNPWRIARCAASQSSSENFGWSNDLTTGPNPTCIDVVGQPNSIVDCPEGTYIVKQSFQINGPVTTAVYPALCTKRGCSGEVQAYVTTATPTITCCPAVR